VSDPRGPVTRRIEGQPIQDVVIHPPFDKAFIAHEHPEAEVGWLGDAIGVDLIVVRFVDGWARPYAGDGKRNEDWFGWMHDVLAPGDCAVRHTQSSDSTNAPGSHSGGQAGRIVFERDAGVFIAYGHVQSIAVVQGQRVRAGDVVAKVGNDGNSWHPHLHVGAWIDTAPLQIRFDLAVRGRMLHEQGEAWCYGIAE